ncbi:acyl-CoA dehydrogenase family protein [Alphaproteobacteria bacterium]|nr:acyl-CoA dehydrogenase family protein [Alphaproteobacteria bacterium]
MSKFTFPSITETNELSSLRLEVRKFITECINNNEFIPAADSWVFAANPEFSRKLGSKGWLGMSFPKQYGGNERTALERYVVTEELLASGAPVAAHWIADRQSGSQVIRYGTEKQKLSIIPKISSGKCFFAIGMSESDSGSDLASVKTKATKTATGWSLEGRKIWSTGAHLCNYMIVLARTSPPSEKNRHEGLSQFLVDLSLPNVNIKGIPDMTGQRHFNETLFDNVELLEDALLGEEGKGWSQVVGELALERSGPERFLSHFTLLDKFIDEFRNTLLKSSSSIIGKLIAELQTLRRMSFSIASMLQNGESPETQAAFVKELGNKFEKTMVETLREFANIIPHYEWPNQLQNMFEDATLRIPSNSLRGGTTEIMKGIIARQLGLR